MLRKSFLFILVFFLFWRFCLSLVAIFATNFPLFSQDRFLGGGYLIFKTAPEFFGWANFDGEHFLGIALNGYKLLEYAFFPLFPKAIGAFSQFSHHYIYSGTDIIIISFIAILVGLLISNLSTIISLVIFYDLVKLDYSTKIANYAILLLIIFPTSFFFISLYSESLFLLMALLSFYLARKNKWFLASLAGFFAVLTRVFGIFLFPALLIELWIQKNRSRNYIWILLIPMGFFAYIYYQYIASGDPLAFYNQQIVVGEQHQKGIVLLPQIFYRYLKIIFTIPEFSIYYQSVFLEILVSILFLASFIYGYIQKVRYSYLFFAIVCFLVPTMQGSFSSLPRYVLILFPSFIIFAIAFAKIPKWFQISVLLISAIILTLETTLFLRGYWVA